MKALFHPVECRCVGGGSLAAALKGIEFSQSLAVAFVFLPLINSEQVIKYRSLDFHLLAKLQ